MRPGDTDSRKAALGMRALKQLKRTPQHYVPGARLQPGRHRADPTRASARFCSSPCRTPRQPPQASSTCVCRSAPWRAACWGPGPACGGSGVHILRGKRGAEYPARRDAASAGAALHCKGKSAFFFQSNALLKSYVAKIPLLLLHFAARQSPMCPFAADI